MAREFTTGLGYVVIGNSNLALYRTTFGTSHHLGLNLYLFVLVRNLANHKFQLKKRRARVEDIYELKRGEGTSQGP